MNGKTTFWDLISQYSIHIPKIQRDYAQGRLQKDVNDIREDFLNAIKSSLEVVSDSVPCAFLELDFVYGSISGEDSPQMLPLDGQQRLTTLFLLHWFAYIKEFEQDYSDVCKVCDILAKFSYASRHWTDKFCHDLIKNISPQNPWKDKIISFFIKDQSWYQNVYDDDPSIQSMLVMLDSIQKSFTNISNIWKKLTVEKRIIFYFQPLDSFGLSDDLYIKMNARGKALTEFEIFKSELLSFIKSNHPELRKDIAKKLDGEWTDFFWQEFLADPPKDNVDSEMLRFIRYYSSMLFYRSQEALKRMKISEMSEDIHLPERSKELISRVFDTEENLKSLVICLVSLVGFDREGKTSKIFFGNFFIIEPQSDSENQKIRIFSNLPQINLFAKCCTVYDPYGRQNPFPISEQLLLYGCLLHLIYHTDNFSKRIRTLRNLLANSEDTLRENYLSQLVRETEDLILNGTYGNENSKFRTSQCKDEQQKDTSFMAESQIRYLVENNQYLRGACHIFDWNDETKNLCRMKTFASLFNESSSKEIIPYTLCRQILLCFGDYSQYLHNNPQYRVFAYKNNVETWRSLLTTSNERKDFENIKQILQLLCDEMKDCSVSSIKQHIASYLASCPKDWRYYMIKYDATAYNEETNYGCYYWEDRKTEPYEFFLLNSSWYGEGYIRWNFFHYCIKWQMQSNNVDLERWGSPLKVTLGDSEILIENKNSGFQFATVNSLESKAGKVISELIKQGKISDTGFLPILQTVGIDQEDRVLKIMDCIKWMLEQ